MMAQIINRKAMKAETNTILHSAQVAPAAMTVLILSITTVLDVADTITANAADGNLVSLFVSILTGLLGMVLSAGFCLYCMAIRRGERAEFLTLFDGFSFAGKIICLNIVTTIFIGLWSALFIIPGIVASYRYRFAPYNLYENPDLSVTEAIAMSKQQTRGYKSQLLMLDLSYCVWALMASLPLVIINSASNIQMVQQLLGGTTPDIVASIANLPALTVVLVADIWALLVSIFYLPRFQCTDLGYYEVACQTSGVYPNSARGTSTWNDNDFGSNDSGSW